MNIIIPMAGLGSRFKNEGYDIAKPFIKVSKKMMIEEVLDGIKYPDAIYTIIVQESFLEDYHNQIELLTNNYGVKISTVSSITQGASCTVLSLHKKIINAPLVICDCDNIISNESFRNFVNYSLKEEVDGCLITSKSSEPCFSYAKINESGIVTEIKEKEVISDNAISGFYFVKSGEYFIDSCIETIIYNKKSKNEFYISDVYRQMIDDNKKIKIFSIDNKSFHCVGTPSQLKIYKTEKI